MVSNVEPRDARLYNQLQIVDVLLGAVGYVWEGYELSPAKLELIKHIESKRSKKLTMTSLPSEKKFNMKDEIEPQKRKNALRPKLAEPTDRTLGTGFSA